MKLCFVCGEYPPMAHGGIGTMVQTLGRALVRAGHGVRVVGVYPHLAEAAREDDEGIDVWRLPQPSGKLSWVRSRRELFQQIANWVRNREIDLVEVPDWQGWAAHWPTLPVPVITRLNGSAAYFAAEMGRRTHWMTTHLELTSLRRSDFWCSVSDYTARQTQTLFSLPTGPHAILPNPVETQPVSPWERRREGMVVFSGTLTEKKGVVQLADAWRGVSPCFPTAVLHMVGKDGTAPGGGSMMAYLQSRLGDAASRVQFHGRVAHDEVLQLLLDARVAVFPSFAEALAIAPLEAMAAGCPTIASSLGSGPEVVVNGDHGLTVDPRRPAEIEEALGRLLADESLAKRLAENGRVRVETRFSIDHLLEANEQFYRQCIAKHTLASPAFRFRQPLPSTARRSPKIPVGARDN